MNTSEVFGPKHHGGSDDPFETIKVLEHWLTPDEMIGFCKGQSIVYQRRHRAKGGLTDLAKSAWYTNYLVKYLASRNLSGLGPTSVLPAKNDGSPKEVPPDQQPVQPAPLPSVSDTAGAVGEPARVTRALPRNLVLEQLRTPGRPPALGVASKTTLPISPGGFAHGEGRVTTISAQVIADSVGRHAPRLTTLLLRYSALDTRRGPNAPRLRIGGDLEFELPDALPDGRPEPQPQRGQLPRHPGREDDRGRPDDPAVPLWWGANQPGMQAQRGADRQGARRAPRTAWFRAPAATPSRAPARCTISGRTSRS